MFNNLTEKLSATVRDITGRGRLTEKNIKIGLFYKFNFRK